MTEFLLKVSQIAWSVSGKLCKYEIDNKNILLS